MMSFRPSFLLHSALHNRKLQVALAVLLALTFGLLGFLVMQQEHIAQLERVEGELERDYSAAENTWSSAHLGERFFEGDGARTGTRETATFLLFNGAQLELREKSQIRFSRPSQKGNLGLEVELGEVDLVAAQELSLESEFGELLIERGSRVALSKSGERLALEVQLGTIQLLDQERTLEEGESLTLEIGGLIFEEPLEVAIEEPEEEVLEPVEPPFEFEAGEQIEFADLIIQSGESAVIHDPKPPTALGFMRPAECEEGVRVKVSTRKAASTGNAQIMFKPGSYQYSLSCLENDDEVVAKGKVRILRDSGQRALPQFSPKADVVTDGRSYTVLYVNRLPQVTVRWTSAPTASGYTVNVDGGSINTSSSSYTFKPGRLRAGTHRISYSAATTPKRQSRTTTVTVKYDHQAPKARLSSPKKAGDQLQVSGQALPGWSVSIRGDELKLDSARRFKAAQAENETLPVVFSHPRHGRHYYLRRSPQK